MALSVLLSSYPLACIQRKQINGDSTQTTMWIEKYMYSTARQTHNVYQNKRAKTLDLSVSLCAIVFQCVF